MRCLVAVLPLHVFLPNLPIKSHALTLLRGLASINALKKKPSWRLDYEFLLVCLQDLLLIFRYPCHLIHVLNVLVGPVRRKFACDSRVESAKLFVIRDVCTVKVDLSPCRLLAIDHFIVVDEGGNGLSRGGSDENRLRG